MLTAGPTLRNTSAAFLASLLATSGTAAAGGAKHFQSETARKLNLPFSEAVIVGDLIFLSGQLGNRPGTPELVEGGIQGEARQTMENIGAVLQANGSSFDKIVKCTIMLADIADWPAFNEVYLTYFQPPYPARSA
ncbi:MAG TPA: Rid family hydrolase, partial [Paracoccaceae bacterium]|nr:Rid family hydrolase [Paracoccaceae bacterium]